MPSSRNGRLISHASGHKTSANMASGQQTTNNKSHKRNLTIV
jgi:hypothetical protein